MSLNKSIEHGKEHRKPYNYAKSIDKSCRNHGSCPWCKGNREYCNLKREESAEEQMREYNGNKK